MEKNKKDNKRTALELHVAGVSIDTIVKVCQVSERTIYRYIKEYEEGNSDIDLSKNVKAVKKFREKEFEDLLELLSSKDYLGKIAMALDNINEEEIKNELKHRGLRGVTGFIGTLTDKYLKGYTTQLEKENLALKNRIASNSRQVVFMNEGEVYASSNELHERHSKDIS